MNGAKMRGKCGPGSRGGKVVGYTKSGAAKYERHAKSAIARAEQHAHRNDSAKLMLGDAKALMSKGQHKDAHWAALRSLKHSVGILHEDYQKAEGSRGKFLGFLKQRGFSGPGIKR